MNIQSPNHPQVRLARPGEGSAIYALKRSVFGQPFLDDTIYASPRSIVYIETILAGDIPGQSLVVAEEAGQLRGYYHNVQRDGIALLNYIGVSHSVATHGVGRQLLMHFEATAHRHGDQRLILDVYERKQQVFDWYQRHGYVVEKISYLMRIPLQAYLQDSAMPLVSSNIAWERALLEEQQRGFSQIECTVGDVRGIRIGLIADTTCRLLHYNGLSFATAAAALAQHFLPHRRTLLAIMSEEELSQIPHQPTETIVRMGKAL